VATGHKVEQDAQPGGMAVRLLSAAAALVQRQREVGGLLAGHLGVAPEGVFYHWAFRRCRQRGEIPETQWRYFFHGLECDLHHADGRALRVDFGPRGRLDTFSEWGLAVFVAHSRAPWTEFADLAGHARGHGSPEDRVASISRACEPAFLSLEHQGLIELADPSLLAWAASHTRKNSAGLAVFSPPTGVPEEVVVDSSVAGRRCISAAGWRLLGRGGAEAGPPRRTPP
jgi:hypothetical protein